MVYISTSDKIELAMVILTAVSVIGSMLYTIYNSYMSNKTTKVMKFNRAKEKVRTELNIFFTVYSMNAKSDNLKLLLANLNSSLVNLVHTAKNTLAKDDELLSDIVEFYKMWKAFKSYLDEKDTSFKNLNESGKQFAKDSLTYINILDPNDYQGHSLIEQISNEFKTWKATN